MQLKDPCPNKSRCARGRKIKLQYSTRNQKHIHTLSWLPQYVRDFEHVHADSHYILSEMILITKLHHISVRANEPNSTRQFAMIKAFLQPQEQQPCGFHWIKPTESILFAEMIITRAQIWCCRVSSQYWLTHTVTVTSGEVENNVLHTKIRSCPCATLGRETFAEVT